MAIKSVKQKSYRPSGHSNRGQGASSAIADDIDGNEVWEERN